MNLESYPPVFRHQQNIKDTTTSQENNNTDQTTTTITNESPKTYDSVPLIDFQCLNQDTLVEACKDWGLFRLVNHGIPTNLLTQLHHLAADIFALSFQSKQDLFAEAPLSYFWGTPALTPSGDALSRGPQNINWVEGFNAPLSQLSQFHPPNPFLHSFRFLLEEYGGHIGRLATTIFRAMAKSLNLDPERSKHYLSESTGLLRVYRYPRCSMADQEWGMDVHTDSSVLSILNQDIVGGLEVLKDDKWVHVNPIPNTLIFNLGDMMQAISNDEYKSAKHRVKVNGRAERGSICYFVFPAEGSVIQSTNYRAFTYGDFQAQVQQDIKELGFKVGLERFKHKQMFHSCNLHQLDPPYPSSGVTSHCHVSLPQLSE